MIISVEDVIQVVVSLLGSLLVFSHLLSALGWVLHSQLLVLEGRPGF